MNLAPIDAIARALLYEGYNLYPYRPSAVKNRHRWTFGTLYPRAYVDHSGAGETWSLETQCLVRGDARTVIETRVRFLHPVERVTDPAGWQDATEREAVAPDRTLGDLGHAADVVRSAFGEDDPGAGILAAVITRRAVAVGDGVFRLEVTVANATPFEPPAAPIDARAHRARAALSALAATHTLLGVRGGAFESMIDPPEALRSAAAACGNRGTWPVLVGDPGARDTMLSSPIILYDYPQIAPESVGDLFDATEIDEILTLRILTLTDDEQAAMRGLDDRTRQVLERTRALAPPTVLGLHGTVRERRTAGADGQELRPGRRVRLRPRRRADVMDLALADRTATVVGVEEDYEGRVFLAVTVDEDPGRDLGARGSIAHRFFFRPDEVEPLA